MDKWVWIDLELTGLDLNSDVILEIAVILTDKSCQNNFFGPNIVIQAPEASLDGMSEFVKNMHKKSKLAEAVRDSRISLQEAENAIFTFFEDAYIENAVLVGNSIHMDRMFLLKHMPRLFEKHISKHRIIDISSVKEAYSMWFNKSAPVVKKESHRSLDDISESIDELDYYLRNLFQVNP